MNKFTRFTLFAGLMAFGLAACGDDVQVVQPEPPPPPALVVSLQPGAVAIEVGQTVDLAVNISGGDASVVPTLTCSASNTAITVTTVGSICRVVGVTEGGNATVTVAVVRGTQNATAGASVEVLEDAEIPATIIIEKITQGSLQTPVALNNVQRQVEVTVNIDPGTQVLDVVTLLYRGVVVQTHDLSPAAVAAMRASGPEAQAARVLTFSWETDRYSVTAVGGVITGASDAEPAFRNGTGALQARVTVDDGSVTGTAVSSPSRDVTLRNLNGWHLRIARTGSTRTALDVQLFEWRGGRDTAGNVGAGLDAHLVPVIYSAGVELATAQFTFRSPTVPAGLAVVVAGSPWTYSWSAATLGGYSMPLATPGYPNLLRDGEYPRVIGNATLTDGQGMAPYGGSLDCLGNATGILNVEISATGLCAGGTAWVPPSATLVAAANATLDPLRLGERIDNAGPQGQTFTLASRPGLPNWPQLPAAPANGALVASAGTWINEGLSFSNGGIHNKTAMIDGVDPVGGVSGVSRAVAGFPAPTFLASTYMASGGALAAGVDITANPTGASLPETITPNVYTVMTVDADELDNRTLLTLSGNAGAVLLGTDWVDPFLQHTAGISNPDRDAFDLVTPGAGSTFTTLVAGDDLTLSDYNYYVNWTDPINVGASGFTAFAGNPVWRHVHRVTSAGTAVVVGGSSGSNVAVAPAFSTATGLLNYGRTFASQQAVSGLSVLNGYYIYRAYVLDDAGNNSIDAVFPATGTVSQESAAIRRQAAVDNVQSTVFGITSPVNMPGGSAVAFASNSSDNLDLGQSFLSLDYLPFSAAGSTFWTANSALAIDAQTPGGYYTPAQTFAPIEGTTGGVRHNGSDSEHGVIFNSPFETAATVVTSAALTRTVSGFIRSVEWVCSGAGTPIASCLAAPADWATDIAVNLTNTPAAVGWFSPNPVGPGDAPDVAYAAGRPNMASFSQFDATRFDHIPRTSGNVNYFLEQVGATDALSPFPHRSVSVAAINPVSVLLNGGLGTEVSPYHTGGLQAGWALRNVTATYGSTGVTSLPAPRAAAGTVPGGAGGRTLTVTATARLITASTIIPGGPGQNLFPGPLGRVDFYALESATGTLRYLGSQNNPVVFENNPACVTNTSLTQANYRCWDFTMSASIPNWVGGGNNDPVQVLAIGVNAAGDGLATFPVDAT